MLTKEKAKYLVGTPATDPQGMELGRVDAIYVDEQTDRPEFAAVRLSEPAPSLVPLAAAAERDGALRVAYPRSQVLGAPRASRDGAVTEEDEARLYAYYGLTPKVTV